MGADTRFGTFVESHGQFLSGPVGSHGLTRHDAFIALALAREADIAMSGGEVWRREGGRWLPAYDNWRTSPRPGEGRDHFLQRSWRETEVYLRQYRVPPDGDCLFVLVPSAPQ